jgi:protoheme IX farnesyltransferase
MNESEIKSSSFRGASKIRDYFQLIKFTLSFTVVFSCVICYLLAPNVTTYDWGMIIILFIAGMLITGSANAINQAVEKDTDAMMKRTAQRPVASGRMSQQEAYLFATFAGVIGVFMMGWFFKTDENGFNWNAAWLSAFSLFLYAFIYTPLKKVNSIAVLVGAFPGALPCLIGWVAATGIVSPFETMTVNGKRFQMPAVIFFLRYSFSGSSRISGPLPG